jgi:hypothetical protein
MIALIASATPEMRAAIGDVLAKVSKEVGARVGPRDYRAAQQVVLRPRPGQPAEQGNAAWILRRTQIQEAVVTLATLAKIQNRNR